MKSFGYFQDDLVSQDRADSLLVNTVVGKEDIVEITFHPKLSDQVIKFDRVP